MPENDAFLHSPYHGILIGGTGSGKTVVANAIHAASDRLSVFFNVQAKGYIRGQPIQYSGAHDNSKIRDAVAGGATKLDIRPKSISGQEEHQALTELLFRLASGGVKLSVFNDEAHEYGSLDESSVTRLHKRGRSFGDEGGAIKSWSISQRWTSINKSARSEAEYLVTVGLPPTADRDLLEDERGFPFDQVRESHNRARWKDTVEGGEEVSRAFSVERNGEIAYGPKKAAAKYAE